MQSPLLPAYILHSRPLGESKLILQLLLPEYGRLSAVIRKRQGKQRFVLQPFQQFAVVLTGRADLKTIYTIDELTPAYHFSGNVLFSGLYLNELICRLWPDNLAAEQLFSVYQHSLQQLSQVQLGLVELEPCLRRFEFSLLAELGLQIDWQHDINGNAINAHAHYQWQNEAGFVISSTGWQGLAILHAGAEQWQQPGALRCAKQLSRQLLATLLGDKPLLSRALFQQG